MISRSRGKILSSLKIGSVWALFFVSLTIQIAFSEEFADWKLIYEQHSSRSVYSKLSCNEIEHNKQPYELWLKVNFWMTVEYTEL